MASVANCSRRLLSRSSTGLVQNLPLRPQTSWLVAAGLVAARSAAAPNSLSSPTSATSSFSTSSAARAKAVAHVRAGKQVQVSRKKKKPMSRGKDIAPGERKAYRKRIVLSNNNALEVPGLEELAQPDATVVNAGRIMALPDAVVDQLRAIEAFKPTQNFSLFRRPSLLVRDETAELAKKLQEDVAASKKTLRVVIDGERLSGKSTMLQQVMAHGFLNDFLVFSIPECHELTTACTEYAAIPGSDPVQYIQANYTLRVLKTTLAANNELLGKLKTARNHDKLANPVTAGSTLRDLINSAKEPDHAWAVFSALWSELTDAETSLPRPPVLITVDGLAHIMRTSDYRNTAFEPIHSHDLVLVRFLVDALGGATRFPHGAAILAATTYGNAPKNPSLDLALAQRRVEQRATAAGEAAQLPTRDPYFRGYDDRVAAALQTVAVLQLKGVSKTETRALLEYWAASGVLRQRVDERAVLASWTLAGNGVVGELERTLLKSLQV
ncbi:hypothetical protein SEUCBS139899_005085 [Sporothrix eucalyptigena]|uniref:Small ribosomal subunit protein mS29 n=1 Tax=Sporothrix eucalyptigena TaxID=1812306 RepID=A0ABP0C8R6_9PEZI